MCRLLKTCCGCFSLRTGSIVSGVCSILLAISCLIVMLTTDVKFKTIVFDSIPITWVKIIIGINLGMTILISILLIIGTIKEKPFFMLPWVILGIMLAIGLLVSIIYTSVECFLDDHVTFGIVWLILGILIVIIYIYMWAVVFSYFQVINDARGRYQKAPYRR